MTQDILIELAKQMNPAAIATLLNQVFQSHQIKVIVCVDHNCLKISLYTESIIDRDTLIFLVKQEIKALSLHLPIKKLKINCHHKVKSYQGGRYITYTIYNIWQHQENLENGDFL